MLFFMTRHAEYKQKSTDSPFLNSIRKILWFYLWTRENLCVLIESSFNLGFYPIIHSSLNWLSSNKHCLHFFFLCFKCERKWNCSLYQRCQFIQLNFAVVYWFWQKSLFQVYFAHFLGLRNAIDQKWIYRSDSKLTERICIGAVKYILNSIIWNPIESTA